MQHNCSVFSGHSIYWQRGRVYLEGLLVDVRVVPDICPPGFAEEDELLKEEDVAEAFLLPERHHELVLPNQLTLLLQIDLWCTMGDICSIHFKMVPSPIFDLTNSYVVKFTFFVFSFSDSS